MTLRTRLLLGLVALAAVGLAVAGAITYRETRADLYHRVDGQLETAADSPQLFFARFGSVSGRGPGTLLPRCTWAQVRLASDTTQVLDTSFPDYCESPPQVPGNIRPGATITVGNPHYRVYMSNDMSQYRYTDASGFGTSENGFLVVAIPLADADHTLKHLLGVEVFVAVWVLLAIALLAWMIIKLGLKPLREMQEAAGAIAAGDLSKRVPVVDESTEVGQLGIALNEMLFQIETAFEARAASESRLRRFIADASHELRTPLTSIRGYAELFRRGAAERPEDLAKTMRRIEEEASRMGVLVEDLLLLARLDQGRPLERDPVDLTRLARDAVDDTRAVNPSRAIDFIPSGPVVVRGDEVRLRQILANLLQNAMKHTPPQTPVHVRVTTEGSNALIEVRDEGPGMAPEDAARVFERFWRADASRTRASGGTGLGLAIVSAIAESHGGRADVITAPGEGATFRVLLPREVQPAGEPAPEGAPAFAPPPPAAIPIAELEESS